MDYKTLEGIVYAQGFVGDYIEHHVGAVISDHTAQLLAMWNRLSTGLDELRADNNKLQTTLYAARNALS